ncbi:MAG: CoA pyrophosphatase [Syntrophomonadaceae bacterium]|nr:CoA pyrophosphatase [Syntrophomonadaceae bacterium]
MDPKIEALRGREPGIIYHERLIKNAILLPLVEYEGETCVLFEKRASHMKRQPGEICFPGGGVEAEEKGQAISAIRETCEELGLQSEDIELIAPLDIMVSPFDMIIYPYLGYIKDYARIAINPDEVDSVFCVPLEFLLSHQPIKTKMELSVDAHQDYPFELIPQGRDYPFRRGAYPVFFYLWKDKVIWGLTALILHHFLELLQQQSSQ